MRAITRSRPPQLRQVCISIQKTRLGRDAQFLVRCLSVTVLCDRSASLPADIPAQPALHGLVPALQPVAGTAA
jgi:hypothetical protein